MLTVEQGKDNPILRTPGKPVVQFDASLRDVAEAMRETMVESAGVGLAGPQVGKSIRLFVADAAPMPENIQKAALFQKGAIAVANPLLLNKLGEEMMVEGCLSLPNILVEVPRHDTITMQGQTVTGETFTATVSGYAARILQHEMDHLDGTLIIDKGTVVESNASAEAI